MYTVDNQERRENKMKYTIWECTYSDGMKRTWTTVEGDNETAKRLFQAESDRTLWTVYATEYRKLKTLEI